MVVELHVDTGAVARILFHYPILILTELMREGHAPGKNRIVIEHPRRKENPLAAMIGRIGSQLAFGQLQNRMTLIEQVHRFLNFSENADAVVDDKHLGTCSG